MGYGPLPSFLTQTPVGTPYVDPVEAVQQPAESPKEQAKRHKRKRTNGFIQDAARRKAKRSMSKMSIMSLVLGLLFLGSLFFIIGFLAAVATLKSDDRKHGSLSAWQASNINSQEDQVQEGQGRKSAHGSGGFKGGLLTGVIQKQLASSPLGKAVGAASASVPAPLKPFARYGIKSSQAEVKSVTAQVNPFATRRRQGVGPQGYDNAQQQPPVAPQPYPPLESQPSYGASVPYPQPVASLQANPQGGYYNQAPLPQQPPMMQYPPQQPSYQQPAPMMQQQPYYYQQPPQQPSQQIGMPQPMMAPPYPQQMGAQQLPYPSYPQPMPPQQGYYR